jgi:hypothetical protein
MCHEYEKGGISTGIFLSGYLGTRCRTENLGVGEDNTKMDCKEILCESRWIELTQGSVEW